MDERLPDVPDIIAAGFELTDALKWWSVMMNTPGHPPIFWWELLRDDEEANLLHRLSGSQTLQ
jgi:hypothetical protein